LLKTASGRAQAQLLAFWTVADALIAFSIAYLFFADTIFFAFLLTLGFMWLVPLVLKAKNLVLFSFWGFLNKTTIRSQLVREFRKSELPLLSRTDFNDPADLYFQEVADDDTHPKSARLFAAMSLGQLSIIARYSFVEAIFARSNLDAALAIYFDELRRDGVKQHKALTADDYDF
jgi:hypothetical protein